MDTKTFGLFRKIELEDGNVYFQLYDICESEDEAYIEGAANIEDFDKNLHSKIFYPMSLSNYNNFEILKYQAIGEIEDDRLKSINDDPILKTEILRKALEIYGDFDLFPRYIIDEEQSLKRLSKNLFRCDAPAKSLVSLISSTIKVSNTHMSVEEKAAIKDNIIVYGPKHSGKSTLLNNLINAVNYPIVTINLTNDTQKNVLDFITELIVKSHLNIDFAQNGFVVIKDNFEEWNKGNPELEGDPYEYLEQLITVTSILVNYSDHPMEIDLRNITFILEQDTKDNNDELFNFPEYLGDYFRGRIKINELTKKDLREYICDSPKSPVAIFSKLLKGKREIVLESDAVDFLVDYAYKNDKIKTINYILDAAVLTEQKKGHMIIISRELLEKLINDFNTGLVPRKKQEIATINKKDEKSDSMEEVNTEIEEEIVEEPKKDKYGRVLNYKVDFKKLRKELHEKFDYLSQFIKGQDENLYDILYQIIYANEIQNSKLDLETKKEKIEHILIQGKPGTGKSYITKKIVSLFEQAGKPCRIEDATKFTEAGYKGSDVEEMLLHLLQEAKGDVEKAQKGILIIDEFDKKAEQKNASSDVSRGSVQDALLKMFEGSKFTLSIRKGMSEQHVTFDTSELLIICLGAFDGLDEIRDARLAGTRTEIVKPRIGFKTEKEAEEEREMMTQKTNKVVNASKDYSMEDYKEFGVHSQILRRLKVHKALKVPTTEDYIDVMLNSRDSQFINKVNEYRDGGYIIEWTDEFIREIAERAMNSGYGFSGIEILTGPLFAVMRSLLIYSRNADEILGVRFTKECIDDPTLIECIYEENKEETEESGKSYSKKM